MTSRRSQTRFILLHWDAAQRGERGAGVANLKQLAEALRDYPTPEECEAAALLLERAATADKQNLRKALFLTPPGRPLVNMMEDVDVHLHVQGLIDSGLKPVMAYREAAKTLPLSESRIKARYLAFGKPARKRAKRK